jgi:hypothetical protein
MNTILPIVAAVGALALCNIGAVAQTDTRSMPVPNASGSQVTNPAAYGATSEYYLQNPERLPHGSQLQNRQLPPVPNASGAQVTNPNSYRSSAEYYEQHPAQLENTPEAMHRRLPPIPNASGSEVTSPNTYR